MRGTADCTEYVTSSVATAVLWITLVATSKAFCLPHCCALRFLEEHPANAEKLGLRLAEGAKRQSRRPTRYADEGATHLFRNTTLYWSTGENVSVTS